MANQATYRQAYVPPKPIARNERGGRVFPQLAVRRFTLVIPTLPETMWFRRDRSGSEAVLQNQQLSRSHFGIVLGTAWEAAGIGYNLFQGGHLGPLPKLGFGGVAPNGTTNCVLCRCRLG